MRTASAYWAMIFCVMLPAGAQIARPQLGYVLDSDGALRPVFGVAAAATLGDPAIENTISFACSAKFCLAKTDAAVVAFSPVAQHGGQSVAAPLPVVALCATCPGPAIIALNDLGAWVYFQASRQLARWHDGLLDVLDSMPGDFAPSDVSPGREILSLRATADGFDYAIVRDRFRRETIAQETETVWIEHYSASAGSVAVIDSLQTEGPVMLLDGGVLTSLPDQLVLTRSDGEQVKFPLAGAKTFYAAGKGYVEVVASGGRWILRTDTGREQLSMLPGASIGAITQATQGAIAGAAPGAGQ